MRMPIIAPEDMLILCIEKNLMNTNPHTISDEEKREAIDDYFECTTFCPLTDHADDCQIICMERHLKGKYF